MRKIAKSIVVMATALGVLTAPGVGSQAEVKAPVTQKVLSENIIIETKDSTLLQNINNKNRIKTLCNRHKKRMKAQQVMVIKRNCGVRVSENDRRILERIVEAEAGGENHMGKLLVANVILNRVKSDKFPSSVKAVVFAHRQFSPIHDGRYYTVHVSKDTKSAVKDALYGNNPSQGALYFMERAYADSGNVSWFDNSLTRLFRYHCHEFYK